MSELEKGYDAVVATRAEAIVRAESLETALKEEQDRNNKVENDYQLFKASSEDRIKYLEGQHQEDVAKIKDLEEELC